MSKMEQLAVKLQESAQAEQAKADAVAKHYQDWIQSLHSLFDSIEQWLQPLVQAGVAKVARRTMTITERPTPDLEKTYDAPALALEINGKAAMIKPLARFCFAARDGWTSWRGKTSGT